MKKLLASFVAMMSFATLMVGCSDGSGGGTTTVSCPAGYSYNGVNCVWTNGGTPITPGTPGTVTGPVQYYDFNRSYVQSWGGVGTVNGDMTIVNSGAYKQFLKEAMAICDRNIWGWSSGLSDCNNWVSGSFKIAFSIDSSMKPAVRFEAYPAPSFFSWNFSLGWDAGGVAFNPLILNSNNTFSLINNSKGFEIRAQGSYWNGGGLRLIQIQVLQGTLQDGYFTYDLYYPYNNVATKFATGKFKKY